VTLTLYLPTSFTLSYLLWFDKKQQDSFVSVLKQISTLIKIYSDSSRTS